MTLHVVILAAGQGKRMKTDTPKVMHTIGGVPMLERVVRVAEKLNPQKIHVIYGNGGSVVRDTLSHLSVNWVEQEKQLGTGHAVLTALPDCQSADRILVLLGDVPLISEETLSRLIQDTPKEGVGIVVAELEDPIGLGRIIRNEMGHIEAIVEQRDATPLQVVIKEVNTGILVAPAKRLREWLPELKNNNKQQEYYLTDIVSYAVHEGYNVGGIKARSTEEVQGVNDLWQLSKLETYHYQQVAKQLSLQGVRVMDPRRLIARAEMDIANDVVIDVNVVLEGTVKIGAHTYIGPNVILRDVEIGAHVYIDAHTVIEESILEDHCYVGPFAHLRPGAHLKAFAKVGNFVEVKKSVIGHHSKVNHLSYVGDSIIGDDVNVGAGVITCNYDGANKYQTVIGDRAFIGSNCALVAPINIGHDATIGAGSTMTSDAPDGQLTVARAKQKTIEGWKRPVKKSVSNVT